MSMTLLAPDVLKNLFICIIVSLAEYQAGVAHVYTQSNHLSGNLDAEFEILSKRFVIFKDFKTNVMLAQNCCAIPVDNSNDPVSLYLCKFATHDGVLKIYQCVII